MCERLLVLATTEKGIEGDLGESPELIRCEPRPVRRWLWSLVAYDDAQARGGARVARGWSMREFDTAALVEPVDKNEVAAFFRGFAAKHSSVGNPRDRWRTIAAVVGITAAVIGLLAMTYGISEEIGESNADMPVELIGMGVVVALFVAGAGILGWMSVRVRRRRGTPIRQHRLARFAAANSLSYDPGPYLGGHLTPWKNRGRIVVTRLLRESGGRQAEFANYELTYGEAGHRETQFGGYCAFRLTTRLPHIVLESVSWRSAHLTSRAVPARAQRLSLEGDFDRFYELYCPEGYERDALYLFTPDVMARLVDHVRGFDVEIIDDWLFLTRSRDVVTLDPETWKGIAAATNALSDKLHRWERWRQDGADGSVSDSPSAAASQTVAPPGRRLRHDHGRGPWILGAVIGAFVIAIMLASALVQQSG